MTDKGPNGRSATAGRPGPNDDRGPWRSARRSEFSWGLVAKLLFLAAVNAVFFAGLPSMLENEWWLGIAVTGLATLLVDWAYLTRRNIAAKYLIPGTIFALAFQVVPVIYSAYISLTNSAVDHRLTQEQAVDQILRRTSNVPGSTRFELSIVAADDSLAFYLVDDEGNQFLGTEDGLQPLEDDQVTTNADGRVVAVDGYSVLGLGELSDRQEEVLSLEVPTDQGVVRATTLTSAAVYEPVYTYDEDSGILTDEATGVVYEAIDGKFTAADGTTLNPGWQVFVGLDNYTRVFTNQAIRGPFLRVLAWNYVFAIASVVLTFIVGLGLAVTLNHPTMKGKKVYRALLVIPYALPSFMTVLVWAGMFNQEFGIINRIFDADVPWLRDPTLAKASILMVNTWLGFPYMFLVSLGALQAIPHELHEAAFVDGASARQAFRSITFPMLMVAVAPLLIAAFAFNFNNFNVIYLLNEGGPPIQGSATPAGHTDILISYTYRLAFESGSGAQWGFASAIAVLIFLMVAGVSAISFRRTRALEELA